MALGKPQPLVFLNFFKVFEDCVGRCIFGTLCMLPEQNLEYFICSTF